MKKYLKIVLVAWLSFGSFLSLSFAASSGLILILNPKDGAVVKAGSPSKLTYNVKPGSEGHHLHVYVDNQKPIIERNVTGCPCSLELPALSAGKHTVVIEEARIDHSLTGVHSAIELTAK